MSDIITKPIQIIDDGLKQIGGGIIDIPLWFANPTLPLLHMGSNLLFPEEKPLPGESDEVRRRRERAKRLNAMQNSLASQDSIQLSSIDSEDLSAIGNPKIADAIASRRDTILTRRAMPGRSQTVLANEAQRY